MELVDHRGFSKLRVCDPAARFTVYIYIYIPCVCEREREREG